MTRTLPQELVHFVSDMYSVERQALAQLRSAPDIAGDAEIAELFSVHEVETERQADLVRARLEALGGKPSAIKDAIMEVGGKGFLLFAKAQPETPGRLVAHAYAYEAMEWGGYEMLRRLAEHAGDADTAAIAREIAVEERTMMQRLEHAFDRAEQASHGATPTDKLAAEVRKHLAEAHALEAQSRAMLERSDLASGAPRLAEACHAHLAETEAQAARLERRLDELGGDTSAFKDAALRLGGINWTLFFQAQADTPLKLAAFSYAFEHLEIAGYELLRRVARRAGDRTTARLCETALIEERAMSVRLNSLFDEAVAATLA